MDDDSIFAEVYGSNSYVKQESAPAPQPALVQVQTAAEEVLRAPSPRKPPGLSPAVACNTSNIATSLEAEASGVNAQDEFNIHLDEPDVFATDAPPANQPGRPPFQGPPRPDAAVQGQLSGRPFAVTGWQPSMPTLLAMPLARPLRPLYVPAGATSVDQDNTAAFPMVAAVGQPIKLPGQTRVTSEEYREFLALGHGEIFDLDLDRVVDAPWQIPGAEPSDFFNYGMDVRKWKEYATRVQQYRLEFRMQDKIATYDGDHGDVLDPDLPPELAAALAVERRQMQGTQGVPQRPLFRPQLPPPGPGWRPPLLSNNMPLGLPPARAYGGRGQQAVFTQGRGNMWSAQQSIPPSDGVGEPQLVQGVLGGDAGNADWASRPAHSAHPAGQPPTSHSIGERAISGVATSGVGPPGNNNNDWQDRQENSMLPAASTGAGIANVALASLPGPFLLGGVPFPAPFGDPGILAQLPAPFLHSGSLHEVAPRGGALDAADTAAEHYSEPRNHDPPTGSLAMGMDASSKQTLQRSDQRAKLNVGNGTTTARSRSGEWREFRSDRADESRSSGYYEQPAPSFSGRRDHADRRRAHHDRQNDHERTRDRKRSRTAEHGSRDSKRTSRHKS